MKSSFIFPLIVVLFLFVSCSSMKTTPESINELSGKIRSKDFTITVKFVNPMRGRQIYLTSDYDLRIKNDSAFAYLPYFGVAYSAPYGGDGGIKFAEPMHNYLVKNHKKSDGWDIHFNIKTAENDYQISLDIFNNGSSTITVVPFNRDMINFSGEVNNSGK